MQRLKNFLVPWAQLVALIDPVCPNPQGAGICSDVKGRSAP